MGSTNSEFTECHRFNKIVSCVLSAVVIMINTYFVGSYVTKNFLDDTSPTLIYTSLAVFGLLYLTFCFYLILHAAVSMGVTCFDRFRVRLMWSYGLSSPEVRSCWFLIFEHCLILVFKEPRPASWKPAQSPSECWIWKLRVWGEHGMNSRVTPTLVFPSEYY